MKQQEAEIRIDTVGRRGDGVGEWQGRPVFVPRALPGETVRVKLLDDRDKGIAARLLEVVAPSPARTDAPCPHYDLCGGCALQHWKLDGYRAWKTERVKILIERAGIEAGAWKDPVFIPHATRRRTTLAAFLQNRTLRLGYHRARSHDITDIPHCMVLSPKIAALKNALRPHLANILTDSRPADIFIQDTGLAVDVMITGPAGPRKTPGMAEREAIAAMAQECNLARVSWRARDRDEPEIIVQRAPVEKRMGAVTVDLPPGAFMQPSAEGEAALVAAVMEPVKQAGAKNILDLFAGCGTFAGPLLACGKVHAVESDPGAAAALKKAGIGAEKRNLFGNPLTEKELKSYDAAVIDPPRTGAIEQAQRLAKSDVPLVISISCNPSTFVRDARILCEGGYRLESLQIIDQFIWSAHIEIAGIFTR